MKIFMLSLEELVKDFETILQPTQEQYPDFHSTSDFNKIDNIQNYLKDRKKVIEQVSPKKKAESCLEISNQIVGFIERLETFETDLQLLETELGKIIQQVVLQN